MRIRGEVMKDGRRGNRERTRGIGKIKGRCEQIMKILIAKRE